MRNNKVLIIYHRVDFDGVFSALIARKYYSEVENITADTFGYTYNDELPNFNLPLFNVGKLVLVDISFPADIMLNLLEKYGPDNVEWVDHHITAINDSEKYGYSNGLPGFREIGKGACELCWKYYFDDSLNTMPRLIRHLSDYDVWNKRSIETWNNIVIPVQLGIRSLFGVRLENLDPNQVFTPEFLSKVIQTGKPIHDYLQGRWKSSIANSSFDITVAGNYKGIAIISPEFNSSMFDSVRNNYQVFCIVSPQRKTGMYSCSLYSEPDGRLGDFQLGQYLKENYGGGGHPTAAGCQLNQEQFLNLIIDKII